MSHPKKQEIGEGDRRSARRYNKNTREFIDEEYEYDSSRSDGPHGRKKDGLTDAEKKARARAKELDPQVSRNYDEPADRD